MKRHLLYLLSLLMLISVLCCGDSVEQGETSLVTITIGGSEQRASAEEAITPAAIPSNVSTISFTFSAPDMDTITRDVAVSGQDEITETFLISNGNNRRILVEAKDSSGNTLYRGEQTIDLDGTGVELTITMASVTPQTTPWARSYGGFGSDVTPSVQQTNDGGYIVSGFTDSFGAGENDFWVLKLNNNGVIEWEKTYGGADDDRPFVIQQTSDGGYVVAGRTGSFDSGGADAWVLKLDSNGDITWEKRYGDPAQIAWEWANSIEETSDGGYIFTAPTDSLGAGGGYDFWVVKLGSDGTIEWQKTYGRANYDLATTIKQTSDDGYILVGFTFVGMDDDDIWVLKLDSSGGITWEKRYGGSHNESIYYPDSIRQTPDGGYIIVAETNSFGAGNNDFWILKLSSDGTIEWQKTYGGAQWDYPRSIALTSDGGYIVSGQTNSFDPGNTDFWVLKLSSDGTIVWQKTYGGTSSENFPTIQTTSDGGYIVAGETASFGAGGSDFWILKLDSNGTVSNFGVDTNITGSDTSVSGVDTSATTGLTTESPLDTTATVTDTAAVVEVQAP